MVRTRMILCGVCFLLASDAVSAPAIAQEADNSADGAVANVATWTGLAPAEVFGEKEPWVQPVGIESVGCDTCGYASVGCGADGGYGCGCQCGGHDFWTRASLSNGFFGMQPSLEEHGIGADLQFTQFYQGVTSGGREQTFDYGAKLDYMFNFDGQKLGLWEGLIVSMHAETRIGEDANFDAVGLAPVNTNMLYPSIEDETAITGLLITQGLSEEWAVSMGKFNLLDLFAQIYPQTGRGINGFMNTSSFIPLSVGRPLNLSILGAGVTKLHEGQVQGTLALLDTNGSSTTTGFDDLFDEGVVLVGYWRLFTEFCQLPGSHALMGIYSNSQYTSTDPINWAFLPDVGIIPGQETGTWNLTYFGEQKLWVDCCNKQRNLGLLTGWGISDGNPNPIRWSGFVSVQGQGLIGERPDDTLGAAYFYTGVSSDFKRLASPVVNVNDPKGVELYYNAAITPWFHLTTDLQFIDPADQKNDTAVVLGFRAWFQL